MNLGNRIGSAFAGLALLAAPAIGAEEAAYDFIIESQPLAAALKEFAEQSGLQVVYYSQLADGEDSPDVTGRMTADQAMSQLLESTDLTFDTMGDDTVVVEEAPSRTESEVTSEAGNRRSMSSPMLLAQTSMNRSELSGRSQEEAESLSADEAIETLEEIVVTGTNIRGVQNPTAPVLQFDREDIGLSGAATVDEFLRTIPQNLSSVTAITENGGDDFNSGTTGTFGSGVNLRGLGAGTTLTLLNGRRMSATGSDSVVDVSVLPLGSIDRIEILTDGASAIYGSDAVAGVVNFITRKNYEGFEVRGRYGAVTDGSKEDYQFGAAGGVSWNTGGVVFGAEHAEADPLLVRELPNFDLSNPDLIDSDATAGVREKRFSGTVSFNQEITDRLSFGVDGLYTDREAVNVNNPGILNLQEQEVRAEGESYFINTRLTYALTNDIDVSVYYDYSKSDSNSASELNSFEDKFLFENGLGVVEGAVSGRLLTLPSGKGLSFAFGGVYRDESYENTSSLGSSSSFDRDVAAVYAELLIPIIGKNNALPFVSAFDVSLAGRYEDYSDFGEAMNPKLGVRWAIDDSLSFMASYSQAFRAPDLFDAGRPISLLVAGAPNAAFTAFPDISADPAGQTVLLEVSGGNSLTEETADVWSVGSEYTPSLIPGLTLSLTYFFYDYSNRIDGVGIFDILMDPAFSEFADTNPDIGNVESLFARADIINNFANAAPEDVEFVLFTGQQNAAERKVEGLDVTGTYERDTAHGELAASINVAYLLAYDTKLTESTPEIDQLSTLYRPIDLKLRGSLSWSRGGLSAFVAVNYTRGYRDRRDSAIANDIDSFTTVDFALTYDFADRLDNAFTDDTVLSFNMRNLLGEEPPFVETLDGLNFDTANADPFGRQVSVSLTKSF